MTTSPAIVRTTAFALLLVAGGTGRAFAQEPATAFADLSKYLKAGNRVFVQDEKGERTKGKITELSETSLQIMTGGVMGPTLTFPADRVARISRIDSRWNGFIIGALAGAVPGMLAGYWWSEYSNNEAGGPSNWGYVTFGSALSLAGGGIGYAIDGAINGQTLVFRRAGSSPGVQFLLRF